MTKTAINPKELQLQKDSDKEQVKNYFSKILELKQSGKEFPVDLDDVWPLVYNRRDASLRELRTNFIEGDDYNLLQNEKVVSFNNLENGVKIEAELSIQCLEYFIVRKVRSVFEVYRKVFHKAMEAAFVPIMDIPAVNINGVAYYEYGELLRKLGYSITSGNSGARRRGNPQEFCNYNGYWRVNQNFAIYMVEGAKLRKMRIELKERKTLFLQNQANRQLNLFGKGGSK